MGEQQRDTLTIRQIVVETSDGALCGVSLSETALRILVPYIGVLSDGPIKLFKLPSDVKMMPLSELGE